MVTKCVWFLISGVLTAARFLDRETMDIYNLTAKAVDIGGKFCAMDVRLEITDVNDNSPVFKPIEGPISISEGAPINTLVYRVSATDADLGWLINWFVLKSND